MPARLTGGTPTTAVAWQPFRLTGQDALAVRASKKVRYDDLLVTALAGTVLRKHLNDIPLWRGDHVAVKQLAEDFARYLYLPRLKETPVLVGAIRDGVSLLLWHQESFAYADSFDAAAEALPRDGRARSDASRSRRRPCGRRGDRATLEIEAEVPSGVPDNVVRIVSENGRTLKFTSQGFEAE